MVHDLSALPRNLESVRDRIARACRRVNRRPDSVQLVAVTKYASLESLVHLYDLGVRDFAESRPQAIWDRGPLLPADVRWHLIGHWQTNKVRRTIPRIACAHSIDRIGLAEFVSVESQRLGRRLPVFIEVKLTDEVAKHGFAPESLMGDFPRLAAMPGLEVVGLMGMAAMAENAESARPAFAALRNLRDELKRRYPDGPSLDSLSMGMTQDFEVAIEEGATHVRIGSALFEGIEGPRA